MQVEVGKASAASHFDPGIGILRGQVGKQVGAAGFFRADRPGAANAGFRHRLVLRHRAEHGDQLRPRPGGQADAVPDQAVLGGRRRAELRHRRVERRVDLQGQASQAHARGVVGSQPGHVADVLVRRRRELEEREPLGVGHLQFGGRHGEILVLGFDANGRAAGPAREIGYQQTAGQSHLPRLQSSPLLLLDRQHGLGRGQQFAPGALLLQGEEGAVIADDQRGPAGFIAGEFLGLGLGRAQVSVIGRLAARRIGQGQHLFGLQRPAIDPQFIDQAGVAGRSRPTSHLEIAVLPDRIVPPGRADLLAVDVGGDLRPLENGRQMDPLLQGQLGEERSGGFRPSLAGGSVAVPRPAHAKRAGAVADEDEKSPRAPRSAGENVGILPGPLPIHPDGQTHFVGAVELRHRREVHIAIRTGQPQRGPELALGPGCLA